jgi:signal recognition particle receptor subunit beta
MVVINYNTREVSCKIVYYGPGLSGKTTNLQYVHGKVPGKTKGDLISLATDADRTLYFDFLPINIGDINGFTTKFQLYTVPGQVFYNATRKLVLRGVDGIVFVADSQRAKSDENVESLDNLIENLDEYGYDINDIPIVLQYNKRDLPDVMTIEEMDQLLNKGNWKTFEACAPAGKGIFDTLKFIIKIVLDKAKRSPEGRAAAGQRVEDAKLDSRPSPESTAAVAATPQPEMPDPVSQSTPSGDPGSSEVEMPGRVAATSHETNVDSETRHPDSDAGPVPVTAAVTQTSPGVTGVAVREKPPDVERPSVEPKRNVVVADQEFEAPAESDAAVDASTTVVESARHGETESTEKLQGRLPDISRSEQVEEEAVDFAPQERETFSVPTMQRSLRRRKKKKSFSLFKWLFRKS